jgi:hypothetical protein
MPVLTQAASVEQATPEQRRAAQERFDRGTAAFRAQRWDAAIERFGESYDLVASPNTQVMLGRALRGAGRRVEAYEVLLEAADKARELAKHRPRYAKAAEVAEVELGLLRVDIALLSVRVEGVDRAEITAGGRPLPENRYSGFPVEPGQVRVLARAADGRAVEQVVVAEPGGSHEAVMRFAAPEPVASPAPQPSTPPEPVADSRATMVGATLPPGPAPPFDAGPSSARGSLEPWALTATGIGVAGFATFAVAGLMARSTESDLEAACTNDVCAPELHDDVERGRREQTIANIGLAVGFVGALAGVTLFVLDRNRDAETSMIPRAERGRRVGLVVAPGWAGVRGEL